MAKGGIPQWAWLVGGAVVAYGVWKTMENMKAGEQPGSGFFSGAGAGGLPSPAPAGGMLQGAADLGSYFGTMASKLLSGGSSPPTQTQAPPASTLFNPQLIAAQLASAGINLYSGGAATGTSMGSTGVIALGQANGATIAGQQMIEAASRLTGFGNFTPVSGGAAFIPASQSVGAAGMKSAASANQQISSIASMLATGRI